MVLSALQQAPEQQRLMVKLLPFDFKITFKAGTSNQGAAALSRCPHSAEFFALFIPHAADFYDLPSLLHQNLLYSIYHCFT